MSNCVHAWLASHRQVFEGGALTRRGIEQQAHTFRRADVIIGPHGAGLTNMLFAADNASVVEFAVVPQMDRCYAYMALALGFDYWLVPEISAAYGDQYELTADSVYLVVDHVRGLLARKPGVAPVNDTVEPELASAEAQLHAVPVCTVFQWQFLTAGQEFRDSAEAATLAPALLEGFYAMCASDRHPHTLTSARSLSILRSEAMALYQNNELHDAYIRFRVLCDREPDVGLVWMRIYSSFPSHCAARCQCGRAAGDE